jgi:four helix bundle protein
MREREGGEEKIVLNYLIYLYVSVHINNIMNAIKSHKELIVYQSAFKVSMEIFNITKTFPKEEVFSLTSQIRRSSRSVSANLAEAFRKRRYEKAFVSKLSDSEGEAAETQVWLDYSYKCGYLHENFYVRLSNEYEKIIGMLVNMLKHPEKWGF